MKLFTCPSCARPVHFENTACTACGSPLAFDPGTVAMFPGAGADHAPCANANGPATCNWLVPAAEAGGFCHACRLNRTIPDLSWGQNGVLWGRIEREKRRLVYAILRFGLPVTETYAASPLRFDFLADTPPSFRDGGKVLTGHANGLVTVNIAEADPVARASVQAAMDEPYRTLLGHLRHESGHYFWDRLVAPDINRLSRFRALFGDERVDYAAALDLHYRSGPPADWQACWVSAYAASHPWEDWAECWANFLHLVDTLETASAFGLRLDPAPEDPAGPPGVGPDNPDPAGRAAIAADAAVDPYRLTDFDRLIALWLPLSVALNSLTRSMGQEDAYPFTLTPPVVEKLRFVHETVMAGGWMASTH